MRVQELIEALSNLDPELEVFYEVDGDACRTGDFMTVTGLSVSRQFIRLTYGGYDDKTEKGQYTAGEPVLGVVIE